MSEPDLIELFIEPLNRLGVEYMVAGALAAIIYGEPRLTNDIDVVAALTEHDTRRIEREFSDGYYVPPLETMEEERRKSRHGHFNLIHVESALKADVYVAGLDRLNEWGLMHRREFVVNQQIVWTAPPEYVIILKMEYWRDGGSEKHRRDIRAMLRTLGPGVDTGMIETEVEQRGLSEQWKVVGSEE